MKKIYIIFCLILYSFSIVISTFANVDSYHIVLDAGHGGMDGGTSVDNILESDLSLEIVYKLKNILESKGYLVTLTRVDKGSLCSGKFIKREDMNKRVEIINSSNANLALSIHMNYFSDSKYRGSQVFYCNSYNNSKLAECIQSSLILSLNNTDRKTVVRDNIYILNRVTIPICIIECGFMSNKNELILLKNSEYQLKLANAIVKGIENFLLS